MTMPGGGFTVRRMTRPDLDFALELAAREGWNPGLHDADAFFRADPDGYFVGLLDGRPIGCISAVSYPRAFGFIGLYIVVPQHRGQGHGIKLWQAALARLQGHNIGLDGVVAQQDNYRQSGFTLAYRNIRYEGQAPSPAGDAADLTDATAVRFDRLCSYDRQCYPAERREFLACWLRMPGAVALARLEQAVVRGYGVIRPCRQGWKIGPLFADNEAVALQLYRGLGARAGAGAALFLDVPEVNPLAVALAEREGMTRVFETARMYTGAPPAISTERVFGVTTLELG
jgi:ribosomal protein S18 acetylase RimI-like enzyme